MTPKERKVGKRAVKSPAATNHVQLESDIAAAVGMNGLKEKAYSVTSCMKVISRYAVARRPTWQKRDVWDRLRKSGTRKTTIGANHKRKFGALYSV